MILISKKPIRPDCIRKITGSFSWIDHRIILEGFILSMSQHEILLYFFLVLVGDKNGVSFYIYDKICRFLKISPDDYARARNRLIERNLVAYEQGRFQVLQVPPKRYFFTDSPRGGQPLSLGQIFQNSMREND